MTSVGVLTKRLEIELKRVAVEVGGVAGRNAAYLRRSGVTLQPSGHVAPAAGAEAVGRDKVLALILPEEDSSEDSEEDTYLLARTWGVRTERMGLATILYWRSTCRHETEPVFAYGQAASPGPENDYGLWSRRSGESPFLRGLTGTSSGPLKKAKAGWGWTQMRVRQPGQGFDLPERILNKKPPRPDLLPGICDEFALGIPYDDLDAILVELECGCGRGESAAGGGVGGQVVDYVGELVARSEHMRAPPLAAHQLRGES